MISLCPRASPTHLIDHRKDSPPAMSPKKTVILSKKTPKDGDKVLVLNEEQKKRVGILENGLIRYNKSDFTRIFRVIGKIVQ